MLTRALIAALIFVLPPVAVRADPCTDLVKMYSNMIAATSYRLVETSPGTPTVTTEYMAPDRIHVSGTGTETITIGTRQFEKLLGKWIENDGKGWSAPPMQAFKAYTTGDMFLNMCVKSGPVDEGVKDGLRQIQLHISKYGVDNVYYLRPDLLPARIEITTRGKTFVKAYSDWNTRIDIEAPQ